VPRLTQTALTWSLVPVAVAIAAALALAAPKPAEAQVAEGALQAGSDRSAAYFAQCLLDWDATTHMTKQEWSRTCQRVVRERGDFLSKPTR
jgi:hypothetical protein